MNQTKTIKELVPCADCPHWMPKAEANPGIAEDGRRVRERVPGYNPIRWNAK